MGPGPGHTQVVEALTRALRLPSVERDLLHRLAGHAAPGNDVVSSHISSSVQRLLDRLSHTPVAVYDATWTLLVANAGYDALLGDTSTWRASSATRSGATCSAVAPAWSTHPTSTRTWSPARSSICA